MKTIKNNLSIMTLLVLTIVLCASSIWLIAHVKQALSFQEFKQDATKDMMLLKEELHLVDHHSKQLGAVMHLHQDALPQINLQAWLNTVKDQHKSIESVIFIPKNSTQTAIATHGIPLTEQVWTSALDEAITSKQMVSRLVSSQSTEQLIAIAPVSSGFIVSQVNLKTAILESGAAQEPSTQVRFETPLQQTGWFVYQEPILLGKTSIAVSIQRPITSVTEFDWLLWMGTAIVVMLSIILWGMIIWYRVLNTTANRIIESKTQHLSFANDILKAVSEVGQQFINESDASKMFDKILQDYIDFTDSEFGFIGQVIHEDDKSTIQTLSITNIAWDYDSRKQYQDNLATGFTLDNPNSLFGCVLKTHDLVIANDPQTDSRAAGVPAGHPKLSSFVGIPLFYHGILVGVVCLANKQGGYQQALIDKLSPMTQNCGFIISEYKIKCQTQKAQALNYQRARNDALTGLPNRYLFEEQGAKLLQLAIRKRHALAIMYVDLDDFKPINDNFGHQIGDELLKQAANLLKQNTRDSDFVARLGGDEFALILSDVADDEPKLVSQKLKEAFAKPFTVMGKSCKVGLSIGFSLYPEHGNTIEDLLHQADLAMYQAKQWAKEHESVALIKPSHKDEPKTG